MLTKWAKALKIQRYMKYSQGIDEILQDKRHIKIDITKVTIGRL
jgi:hypothetical protein